MASEEENNDESAKGFSGFSSMVSVVDDINRSEEIQYFEPSKPIAPVLQTERQSTTTGSLASQKYRPNKIKLLFWVIIICAVIFLRWLIIASGIDSNRFTLPNYSAKSDVDSSFQQMDKTIEANKQSFKPIRPSEEKPPVGTNLNLTVTQISYCLAEDLRLSGAKQSLNNDIEPDVDLYNQMINDYNARCGYFHYRAGTLDAARLVIDRYREILESDGRARFTSRSSFSISSPANINTTIKAEDLINQMLENALIDGGFNKEFEIQQLKLEIERLPKPIKGKKKIAREFNENGLILLKVGDLNAAVTKFQEAYELDKSDTEIASNLGYAYLKQGNLDLAKETIVISLTLTPGRAVSWDNLAVVFGQRGDINKAIACFSNTYRFSKNRLRTHQFMKKINQSEEFIYLKQARNHVIDWAEKKIS